jgi:hypothetical protein
MGRRNGLITKDKFCLSRFGKLALNWSRYEVYLERKPKPVTKYADDEEKHHGGVHEPSLASSPPGQPTTRWRAPLGSSLPTAHSVGQPDRQSKLSAASDMGGKS